MESLSSRQRSVARGAGRRCSLDSSGLACPGEFLGAAQAQGKDLSHQNQGERFTEGIAARIAGKRERSLPNGILPATSPFTRAVSYREASWAISRPCKSISGRSVFIVHIPKQSSYQGHEVMWLTALTWARCWINSVWDTGAVCGDGVMPCC